MDEILQNVTEVIITVNENVTHLVQDKTELLSHVIPMILGILKILCMASIPILIGSFNSTNHLKNKKKNESYPEILTLRDALMFPLLHSVVLYGYYLIFKIIPENYINLLIGTCSALLGDAVLFFLLCSVVKNHIPPSLLPTSYLILIANKYENKENRDGSEEKKCCTEVNCVGYFFIDAVDVICFLISTAFSMWYAWQKHWIANNVFALAFAIFLIQTIHLNTIINGCILLGGLVISDIFWVYATDVMETVTLTLDAPNKLLIPLGFGSESMITDILLLGLGDVIIPGLFIAFMLRFDKTLQRKSNDYFLVAFIGYIIGLIITSLVSGYFRRAQPALLFLVPTTIILPTLLAVVKGDAKMLHGYRDDHVLGDHKAITGQTQFALSYSRSDCESEISGLKKISEESSVISHDTKILDPSKKEN